MNWWVKTGRGVAVWTLRLALSGVFLYAGAEKMREPQSFAESIASFQLLPAAFINPMALALPSMEILAAILVLTGGRWRRAGAFCLLALIGVFLIALGSALSRGLPVDCGCFGSDRFDVLSPTKNLWIALWRDVVLGAVAGFLYVDARRNAMAARR